MLTKSSPVALRAKNDKMMQMNYLQMMETKDWLRRRKKMLPFDIQRERGILSCLKKIAITTLGFSNNGLRRLFKLSQFLLVRLS
jgi:hypothetical protein